MPIQKTYSYLSNSLVSIDYGKAGFLMFSHMSTGCKRKSRQCFLSAQNTEVILHLNCSKRMWLVPSKPRLGVNVWYTEFSSFLSKLLNVILCLFYIFLTFCYEHAHRLLDFLLWTMAFALERVCNMSIVERIKAKWIPLHQFQKRIWKSNIAGVCLKVRRNAVAQCGSRAQLNTLIIWRIL